MTPHTINPATHNDQIGVKPDTSSYFSQEAEPFHIY